MIDSQGVDVILDKALKPIVTILTPIYNRADQLVDLWKSLCMQTDKKFEWLIVDDGSEENVEAVVQRAVDQSDFGVRLISKPNGGKHTALNLGISQIATPMTFIVDSDDVLTMDAVEQIIKYYCKYIDNDEVCGFSFLRGFPNGTINGKLFKEDELINSYINVRVNSNDMLSDKAEAYKTKCLREYPFPEFLGERFLGEDVIWMRMARRYKTVHINKVIYIGQYQNDGLTKNRRKHNLQSPRGCVERAKEYLHKDIAIIPRIKAALQYNIYGRVAGYSYEKLSKESPSKLLTGLAIPIATIIRKKWTNRHLK